MRDLCSAYCVPCMARRAQRITHIRRNSQTHSFMAARQ
ncbi:hypothetical protein APY03_6446 [Variovorax sp. WDL1]|nr:hypothetical protein APY03_6446 [Variovorax sp. WDL1]